MALTNFTDKNIANGDQVLAEINASIDDFATMVIKFTSINQDVKVKIEQTVDDLNWSDISYPGGPDMAVIVKGSGPMALNIIGLHCIKIRVIIKVLKATVGIINKISVFN